MAEVRRRRNEGTLEQRTSTSKPKGKASAGTSPEQESASGKKSSKPVEEHVPVIIEFGVRSSNYTYLRRKCRTSYRKVKRVPFEAWLLIGILFAISLVASFYSLNNWPL